MYSCVKSYGINGIDAYAVTVETTLSRSIPSFDVVGLPDAAVKESRSRVQSALVHAGYELPLPKSPSIWLLPARKNRVLPSTCPPFWRSCLPPSSWRLCPKNLLLSASWVCPVSCVPSTAFSRWQFRQKRTASSVCMSLKPTPKKLPSLTAWRSIRFRTSNSSAAAFAVSRRLLLSLRPDAAARRRQPLHRGPL